MVLDAKKFNFRSQEWLSLKIRFIMTLYYKMRQILLQNATAILLQNPANVSYKMRQVFSYKMRQFKYKMRQLLQNASIL